MTGKKSNGVNESKCGEEDVVLKSLFDAFGSAFSLDEIASAYVKASCNADLAGEILVQMQGSASSSTSNGEDHLGKVKGPEKSYQVKENLKTAKSKVRPYSTGTVSNIIGKEYACSKPSANKFAKVYRPVKVGVKVLQESSSEGDCTSVPSSNSDYHLHHDMEDFLFKMLGDGFRLKREVVREVLGSCGYDMKKSMENLLNRTTNSVDKKLGSGNKSSNMTAGSCSSSGLISCQRNKPDNHYPGGNESMASSKKLSELTNLEKTKIDLQREVFSALFIASEEPEEELLRKIIVSRRKQSGAYGRLVREPLKDTDAECEKRLDWKEQIDLDVEEEDNSFQLLRKAVREYRGTAKEYYAAAIDAFTKGDSVRAAKLIDEGHFFLKKAREADEQSGQLIFELSKNADSEDDEMLLDLTDLGGKEAVRILKSQISSLSGIPTIKQLKVIMEADKDTSKRSCRRLVMKLLEKESIEWTEEEDDGSIFIRLDTIDRNRLSFVKRTD